MSITTNINHFLNDDGELADLNPESRKFVALLTSIIEQASSRCSEHPTFINTPCQSITDNKVCLGDIATDITNEDQIIWECVKCGENGLITEWQNTQWNHRKIPLH